VGVFFGGRTVVIMDNSVNIQSIRTIRQNSILIGCIGIVIIGWLSFALSEWIVFPVKQAMEKQKQFVSDVSHELKTPLAVISANTEVLEDEVGENKWLGYIKSETDRMNGLVSDLLTLSRLDASAEQKNFIKFDMSKMVEGVTMPFEVVAFDKGVMINCEPGQGITVSGEEEKLKQVVAILIDNAIKHTYEGGNIDVSLKSIRGKAVLEVVNTGDEIPKESRQKIFERFYRLDEARNSENGGHGLGLAIAKSIIDRHGGTIGVECNAGKTKFKVSI
jgi:signal transduction histidine kinase